MKSKYNTKQREKILNYLIERQESNITAEEIIKYFNSINEKIGKATVYRYLNNLVDENIIKKYIDEDKKCASYQYIDGKHCDEHYHLKCEKCQKVIHLECEEFKNIQEHILQEHNFQIDGCRTVLYGLCDKCARK